MIPANRSPYDLKARDVLGSLTFAQRLEQLAVLSPPSGLRTFAE